MGQLVIFLLQQLQDFSDVSRGVDGVDVDHLHAAVAPIHCCRHIVLPSGPRVTHICLFSKTAVFTFTVYMKLLGVIFTACL